MADVFVSYQKTDRKLAERVVHALASVGYSVWWDDRLTPAESWDRLIEREIRAAKCVLVLWTEHSVGSDWVRIEANFAKDSQPSKLVQVRFDQCTIPMAYSLIQYADLSPRSFASDDSWRKVIEWIAMFAGSGAGTGEINTASEAPPTRARGPTEQPRAHVTQNSPDTAALYFWGAGISGALSFALTWMTSSAHRDAIGGGEVAWPQLIGGVAAAFSPYVVVSTALGWAKRVRASGAIGLFFGLCGAGMLGSFAMTFVVMAMVPGIIELAATAPTPEAVTEAYQEVYTLPVRLVSGFVHSLVFMLAVWGLAAMYGALRSPKRIGVPLLLSTVLVGIWEFQFATAGAPGVSQDPILTAALSSLFALMTSLIVISLFETHRPAARKQAARSQ